MGRDGRLGSLDDAQAARSEPAQGEIEPGTNELEELLRSDEVTLYGLLSLTLFERLRLRLGMHFPVPILSKRMFHALDLDGSGLLPAQQLETISSFLSHYFPVGKPTADMIQVQPHPTPLITPLSIVYTRLTKDACCYGSGFQAMYAML